MFADNRITDIDYRNCLVDFMMIQFPWRNSNIAIKSQSVLIKMFPSCSFASWYDMKTIDIDM